MHSTERVQMQTIAVHFTATLVENHLGPGEVHPALFCYLSSHVSRQEQDHDRIPLVAGKTLTGKITGHASRVAHAISSNTAFCTALFAWRRDETSGFNCELNLGTARFTLEEAEAAYQSSKPIRLALIMHTTSPVELKAVVEVVITKIDMGSLHFDGKRFDPTKACAELKAYYDRIRDMKRAMGETLPGTSNMDAPYDFSESGFTTCSMPMPFLAFAMRELPATNTAMWESALEIVLHRDGMTLYAFQRLTDDGKARVLATLVTLIPSYHDYTSDIVVRESGPARGEGMEKFGAEHTQSGDCEDKGDEIALIFETFCQYPFELNTQLHRALRELQHIGRNYVALRVLQAVKGAQVSDRVTSYGAHLNAILISFAQLKTGLERHGGDTEKLSWPADMDTDTSKWPLMVAEGTGIYEPLGYTDRALLPAKGYVYNLRSLASVKKPIGHERSDATPFFVAPLIGITGYFAQQGRRGVGLGTFFVTNGDRQQPTRGSLYTNFTKDKTDAYGFIPMPELSAAVMEAINESNAVAIPPLPLVLDRAKYPGNEHDPAYRHEELDRLVAAVAAAKRRAGAGATHEAVPLYLRPYQLGKRNVDAMIADFARANRIYKVTYHLERITNNQYGYRVMVHVNTERD